MGASEIQRSTEIQTRFFEAFNESVRIGRIKSLRNFCEKHGLNRTRYAMLINCADNPKRTNTDYRLIDMAALAAICEDAGVSARWLLLGKGNMFRVKKTTER